MSRLDTSTLVGKWPGILAALNIDRKHLVNKHGPCPVCGGKDRFRFDNKEGRGTWFCSNCGSGDGFTLLRQVFGWSFIDTVKEIERIAPEIRTESFDEPDQKKNILRLRETWTEAQPLKAGDPVCTYLDRRGIPGIHKDLRFHANLYHSDGGRHPAMLALMRYPTGEAASIHRTYLTNDGSKASVTEVKKIMSGKPTKTSSVWLGKPAKRLGIAEGIETALAAAKLFALPVWAATTAILMESWVPPTGVQEVLIFADNDGNFVGQTAAFTLARRLNREGLSVEVMIPEGKNSDWADQGK